MSISFEQCLPNSEQRPPVASECPQRDGEIEVRGAQRPSSKMPTELSWPSFRQFGRAGSRHVFLDMSPARLFKMQKRSEIQIKPCATLPDSPPRGLAASRA